MALQADLLEAWSTGSFVSDAKEQTSVRMSPVGVPRHPMREYRDAKAVLVDAPKSSISRHIPVRIAPGHPRRIGGLAGRSAVDSPVITARCFPRPWTVEETQPCFIVRDHTGQALAFVYFAEEPGRSPAADY
jgi:hypothetical protein